MKAFVKRRFFIIAVLMAVISVSAVSAQSASEQSTAVEEQSQDNGSSSAIKYIAAALENGFMQIGFIEIMKTERTQCFKRVGYQINNQ